MIIPKPRVSHDVLADDGVRISVQEWGNADGPPILFLHAFSQSHLGWAPLLSSPLADRFRLVTFDLRGHGNSAKPQEGSRYTNGAQYAEDVAAVVDQCKLTQPTLVAWSIGGIVVGDYIARFGDKSLSGIVYVGAAHQLGAEPGHIGPAFAQHAQGMVSDDLATNVAATIAVGKLVTSQPVDPEIFNFITATNMVVSPLVRHAMLSRTVNHIESTLPQVRVPVRLVHGIDDRIVLKSASEEAASVVPNSQLVLLDGVGHAPHLEATDRVVSGLAQFVSEVAR